MTINKATRFVDVFNAIRDAAVAMTVQTPKSPDLQELLRKLQTTLAEYLGSEPSEGILVEPDPIATEDGCVYIDATDVAMMMALLKIARIAGGSGTRDSFIDLAGYAACGGECADV